MEYNIDIVKELLDEIIDDIDTRLFEGLNGGVVLHEDIKYHPESINNDLVILGEYQRHGVMRRINIYYGSIVKIYPHYNIDQIKERLKDLVDHELRHHVEYKAGVNDLVIEDYEYIKEYKKNRDNR